MQRIVANVARGAGRLLRSRTLFALCSRWTGQDNEPNYDNTCKIPAFIDELELPARRSQGGAAELLTDNHR